MICKLWIVKFSKISALTKTNQIKFQSAFTCSKLTIETLEQGMKYVQTGEGKCRLQRFSF